MYVCRKKSLVRKGLCLQLVDDVSVSCAISACTHMCVCVWMIQQLVQLQSVTAARPLQHKRSSDKNKQDFYFDISCGQWADPCRWCVCVGDPVVFGSVERTGRRAAAEHRGESCRLVLLSSPARSVDFITGILDSSRPSSRLRVSPVWIRRELILTDVQLLSFNLHNFRHFRILTSDAPSSRQVSFNVLMYQNRTCPPFNVY